MHTLKLTDGTTTIDFGNPAGNYPLADAGYRPSVNGLRIQSLGGRGIYDEVEETITFEIVDPASAAACYARLNTLTKLLLQAARFARGEAVSPVVLQYSPDGAAVSSSGSPLQALVIGFGDKIPSGIEYSPEFLKASSLWVIKEVTITLRRGVWLQGTETQTASVASDDEIASFTFATNVDYMSPTDVLLSRILNGQYVSTVPALPLFAVIGSGPTSIQNINASNTTGGPGTAGWSYVNDAALLPRNGYVLRYTPAGTAQSICSAYGTASLVKGRRYAVLGSCRNNSNSVSFAVSMGVLYSTQYAAVAETTETTTIKPYSGAFAQPRYVSFGTFVASVTGTATIKLLVSSSAAAGSIDFDRIVVVEADNASIVQFGNSIKVPSTTYLIENLSIENRFLTALTMSIKGTTTVAPISDFEESRNGGDVLTVGAAVRAMNLGTVDAYWRQNIGVGWVGDWSLTRTRVHLSPE